MNKQIFLTLIIFCSFLSLAESQETWHEYVLKSKQVGRFKIGMTVDDLYTIYGVSNTKLFDLRREGFFTPAIEVCLRKDGTMVPLFVAEFKGDIHCIWLIRVIDKRFKTEKGIGVGSTLGDLRKTYRVRKIDFGEMGFYALVEGIDMAFLLDTDTPEKWHENKDPNIFPDKAKICGILVN